MPRLWAPVAGPTTVRCSLHLSALLLLLAPRTAAAQVLQTLGRDGAGEPESGRPHLRPREGLQMAFSAGLRFPMGDATHAPGDSLAARYSYQLPLTLDIGAKVTKNIYAGGYLGWSWGAEGNANSVEEYCDDDDSNLSNDISCSTHAYRVGLEAQYHLSPEAEYNPWFGYGFGLETVNQSLRDAPRGFRQSTQSTALTLARLNLGVDYRSRSGVGMGLFSEASAGRFFHTRTEVDGNATYAGGVDDAAFHLWVGAGLRLVLFP